MKRSFGPLCLVVVLIGFLLSTSSANGWIASAQTESTPDPSLSSLPAPRYPLKRSSNPQDRYLVDQNNRPYFINADTPWALIGQVSKEDAELYLQDAAAKQINTIIVTLVESFYTDNAPKNYYNVDPYLTYVSGVPKFDTPNEAYFAHADWVINRAGVYGIQVILAPNYLGCCGDGYYNALKSSVNSLEVVERYGKWVGERYKNVPNIMYVWGNDLTPTGDVKDKINAMAKGVLSMDPHHLHMFHGSGSDSLDDWNITDPDDPSYAPWLGVNAIYTYNPVQDLTLRAYNRSPFLPFFLFESYYERDINDAPPLQIRKQAYVAVLTGASGNAYGNQPIWHMNGRERRAPISIDQCPPLTAYSPSPDWKCHLNDEARADLPHFRNLFLSRDWAQLVPDQTHTVVTAGYGSFQSFAGVARTRDGGTVIVYLPDSRQFTVDMTTIAGVSAKAWWYNPREGTAQLIATYPTSGTRQFTPPDTNDWVLVIDDASRDFGPPGIVAAVVVDQHTAYLPALVRPR